VKVHMHNRLSGGLSNIDTNVITRWLILAIDPPSCRVNQPNHGFQLFLFDLEYVRDVTSNDD